MQPSESTEADWAEAKRVFAEALELPKERRGEYLDRVCARNPALRREVESLLESHDADHRFFEAPPVPVRVDPLIGARIGAYRVLRAIGQGGMGIVYLAERADGEFRRRVALKAVRPEYLDDQTLRRFENERRTLAVLDHPHIIRLLDGGTTPDGLPFLVTDYVEGQAIDQFCGSRKLPVRERLELFREVLGAVHYAHQNLVVHRDLKPSNILVTPDGAPKLLDFGIAKLLRPEYLGGPMGLTRTSAQPLTPEFASPEQVLGQPITTASDIYSLGVILYRLLTGRHPFERKTNSLLELEHAICETEPERPSTLPETPAARMLRGDLDNIVLMAIRKEPQRRYASAEHFSEDIRRHLEGWPVLARRSSAWYRATKFVGRHRTGVAAGVLLTAGMLMSAAAAFQEMRVAEKRFNDLHLFANFVIRDLDSALRRDVTDARKQINAEGMRYLDGLAKEAGRDRGLRLDLIESYTRSGDVIGSPYQASQGDAAAAEKSYRRALELARGMVREGVPGAEPRLALAKAAIGIADIQIRHGRPDSAFELYNEARREGDEVLASEPADKQALLSNSRAWDRMLSANEQRGNIVAALECSQQYLKYAELLKDPRKQAFARERRGTLLRRQGKAAEGEAEIRRAIQTYEAMGDASGIIPLRRNLAKAYKSLGDAQMAMRRFDEAEHSYRRSLDDLARIVTEASGSVLYKMDLGQGYNALIDLLLAAGKTAEARSETATALGVLRPMAERAAPTAWQQIYYCAWLLVTTGFPALRDDAGAQRLAQRMQQAAPNDPEVLDVLARVYARKNDTVQAVALEQKALDTNPDPEVRARIETEISALRRGEDRPR